MTVLFQCAGSLPSHFGRVTARLLTRHSALNATSRVIATSSSSNKERSSSSNSISNSISTQQVRYYANGPTAPSKPRGRPKQHTGREPAKRAIRNRSAAKPRSSTTSKASTVGRPRKTTAKATKKKTIAVRPKKPLSKVAVKKAATLKQKDLREKALLNPPKRLPDTAWLVLSSENTKTGANLAQTAKENGAKYKSLTPEEHERLNHVANQNKAKNEIELKKWLNSHTPQQIRDANNARALLNKAAKAKGVKKHHNKLKDDRLVSRPTSSYIQFSKQRWDSGDFKNMNTVESSKLIGREWKALSTAQKQPFEDMFKQDLNRYLEEHKTVYGIDAQVHRANGASVTA